MMMVRRTLTSTQLTETAKKKNITAAIVFVSWKNKAFSNKKLNFKMSDLIQFLTRFRSF